ncbi:ABC-type multidrug transport system permease subunit [Actinokineospora baliensis]|uniref:hypothetical protein n=1 Tax=Actinokineospora baliensis TaxID=547056 RepID=UPI00195BD0A2|nr:hypothetical protein [Actinokineospora baliensis]MBM7775409.1 ABC-type multidrug transport system permease subunit [Actinokineospora baliensis]
MSERNSRALRAALPAALTAVGLVLVATGMFLPWFRSGAVLRDSFQAIGVITTLGFLDGTALELLLYAWYGVIPAITLSIVLYALGFRFGAATIGAFLAIVTGTVSGGATVESGGGDSPLGIAAAGPTTTLIGSALAVLGAVGIVVNVRKGASRIAGGEP